MNPVHNFGTVILGTDGKGYYTTHVGPVAVALTLEVYPDEITYGENGKIEYAYGYFQANFINWDIENGHPYTDARFVDGINQYLGTLGYTGRVNWSEQGRQTDEYGDFDFDGKLIEEIFPQFRKAVA